jgi:DNA-binding transcriptional LysR family regulator
MKKNSPTQKELCEYDWALQERGGLIWRYFQALFASANLEPPMVTLTANSVQTLKSIILSSDPITMLPRISIRNEEKNKALRPIPLRAARWRRQIAVLRRSNGSMLPAVNVVLTEFRKTLIETSGSDQYKHGPARAALR